MIGEFVLVNGSLVPKASASFSLDDPDICYGYGCYETLKVREALLYHAGLHVERLLGSAAILGIAQNLDAQSLVRDLERLVRDNGIGDCNLKILLVGREGRAADCYAFLLPPLFPPANAATEGVECLVYRGERHFPRAKSLSMLLSTIAFRAASMRACWDALLVNRREEITEGTRTNIIFFETARPQVLLTPPGEDCLPGITKLTLSEALAEKGIPLLERALPLEQAKSGKLCLLVTSSSSNLLPIRGLIDGERFSLPLPEVLGKLQAIYAAHLKAYASRISPAGD